VRIHTVFLDMDGVLVDFTKGWLESFGFPASHDDNLPPLLWNVWE
jgi:beta-phosphoglucomutase-like phosphatase (HAD superfamily)